LDPSKLEYMRERAK
jgi:hypothetical protein